MRIIQRKMIALLLMPSLFLMGFLFLDISTAMADTYPYNPSNLINDSTFTNTSTMSPSAIQTFLVDENSGLKSLSFTEACNPTTPVQPYGFNYYSHCGQTESAAQIIYDAGQAYGINPQVILSTMQKEQTLVTTPNPTSSQLNCAMGYNSCGSDSGFFSQVDNATWQLRLDIESIEGNSWWGYSPSNYPCNKATSLYSAGLMPGSTVTFANPHYSGDPVSSGTQTITIANAPTAALYCYTPYVGPYSQTGYSGSYNFVQSFEEWFGDTQGGGVVPQAGAVWRLYYGPTNDHLLTSSASEADTYIEAGWYNDGIVAHAYDGSGGVPVYRLWNGSTHYYTTNANTVSTMVSQGWLSDGVIFESAPSGLPVWELQKGSSFLVTSNPDEFTDYLEAGWQSDGIAFYEDTNNVYPVWRLYYAPTDDHLLTASPQELTTYLAAGWHDDGIIFDSNSTGTPVYRLWNGALQKHFYTSNASVVSSMASQGWGSDGIVFYVTNTGTPVYQLQNGNSYFVTADPTELSAYESAGWQNNGVIFSTINMVAARRLYQPATGSHMTVEYIGSLWNNAQYGWVDDGIQFYVSATYGTPVYQLYSQSQNSYFYTTSQNEINTYTGTGTWQNNGVVFFTPASGEAVYRLFNGQTHILIGSEQGELVNYENAGWGSDGIVFYAYDSSNL